MLYSSLCFAGLCEMHAEKVHILFYAVAAYTVYIVKSEIQSSVMGWDSA